MSSTTPTSLTSNELENVKRLPIMISLIIGAFFSILNETLLNIAFPKLMVELNVTASTLQWLATSYMLIVGVLVPASALVMQWFTTRQMFLGAMTLFTVGTLISGIAPHFAILLIGRMIQAAGTGLLMPVLMNTILVLYPLEKRGTAMGTLGLVMMFAPAIGPTLSGLILESLHWRWLFFLVLPFAVFSIVFAFIYLKNVSEPTKPKIDIISVLLSTIGFGGFVYGFSGSEGGFTGIIVVSIIALILFVFRQMRLKEPLLDLRAFKYPMFAVTTVLLIVVMMTLFSTLSLLPFLFQGALGLTVFASGLLLLPGSFVNGLMSPVAGKLFDRFGPRVLVIPATGMVVIIMWFFMQVSMNTSKMTFLVLHICLMFALSMIMMPAQTNGLNQLPPRYYPHGIAILNTLSQIAGAIGVAFFIGVMTAGQHRFLEQSSDPSSPAEISEGLVAGINNAFMYGFALACIAFVLALFIKRTQPPKE